MSAPAGGIERVHAMPVAEPYPYVYVNVDGTARELHADERRYLEAEYEGGDGAAPSIKSSYSERNGWDEIRGYLKRSQLPAGIPIHDAPAENPNRPLSREETIAWLRSSREQRRLVHHAGEAAPLGRRASWRLV
jgi:hypothetical protein